MSAAVRSRDRSEGTRLVVLVHTKVRDFESMYIKALVEKRLAVLVDWCSDEPPTEETFDRLKELVNVYLDDIPTKHPRNYVGVKLSFNQELVNPYMMVISEVMKRTDLL